MSSQGGTAVLTNSTITGSSAVAFGGAFHATNFDAVDGDFSIVHSTIVGNASQTDGGGVATSLPSGVAGHIYNSIIGGNTVSGVPVDFAGTSVNPASSSNIISTAASSGGLLDSVNGNIVGNSGLGVLDLNAVLDQVPGNFGGPGHTFRLTPTSLALNAADANRSAEPGDDLIPDILGGDRPLLNDGRAFPFARSFDGAPDIGAYEDQTLTLTVDTHLDELDLNFEADDLAVREAAFLSNLNPNTDTILFSLPTGETRVLLNEQLVFTRDVVIDGSNRDELGNEGANITLDGQSSTRILLVDGSAGTFTVAISDTNFENGAAADLVGEAPGAGGAIQTRFARVELERSVFRNNRASDSGGALYNDGGELLIVESTLDSNEAGILGGGVANDTGSV